MSKISLLSQCLVEKYGLPQSKAIEFVSAMFTIIRDRIVIDRVVKVKGLGTFKLAEMNSRESVNVNTGERITIEGRYKLTFTPENTVRDRINSPFLQFESIDIDDVDIDFSEIDKLYEEKEQKQEEIIPAPANEELPPNPSNPLPEASEASESSEHSESSESSEPSSPQEVRSPFCENLIREELDRSHKIIKMLKWLLGLVVALLVCVGIIFAYHLGKNSSQSPKFVWADSAIVLEHTEEGDTTDVHIDSLGIRHAEQKNIEGNPQKTEPEKVEPEKIEAENKQKTPDIPDQSQYEKDERIRTGAYAILGIDTVVTVQKGQTFRGICRAYLGDGMECYVQAVNDGITSAKPGDKVKIPKVKLKKLLNKK